MDGESPVDGEFPVDSESPWMVSLMDGESLDVSPSWMVSPVGGEPPWMVIPCGW